MFSKKKKVKWFKLFSSLKEAEAAVVLDSAIKVMVDIDELCLVRTRRGFYAIKNQCPHQAFPLHNGVCTEEDEIICPYHRYKFDLKTGNSHSENCSGRLQKYAMKINEKGLFIGLEKEVWSLF